MYTRHLIQDVKTIIPTAPDPYSFGKQLGRISRLALIADNLGTQDPVSYLYFEILKLRCAV